jgi:hypothetical protein
VILLIEVEPGHLYGQDNVCKPYPAMVRRNGGASKVERPDAKKPVSQELVDRPVGQVVRS